MQMPSHDHLAQKTASIVTKWRRKKRQFAEQLCWTTTGKSRRLKLIRKTTPNWKHIMTWKRRDGTDMGRNCTIFPGIKIVLGPVELPRPE
ncbi:hypothetical protein NQ317_017637 [Molorchus minor]|uniref:Uncharacterized protein n=1 Tax=Molorchus minor TaxID=1323400 RepID=A0ABQ9J5S1_9CUCU|nr:hypothetical protein NQ317_017637 [Molorchus minor]